MNTNDTLLFLIIIIVAARVGGEIAERFRQPAVLGEIIAGIMLSIIPGMRPAITNDAILFIAEIGVILLLFEVGLESELADFLRVGAPALLVAVTGLGLALTGGFLVSTLMGYPTRAALFLAGALGSTSIGVTARVFKDLRQIQRKEAKIVIGAAVADDILGLLVLSVMMTLVTGGNLKTGGIVMRVALAIGFLAAALIIGKRAAPFLIDLIDRLRGRGVLIISAFTVGLVFAYIGSRLGLATIIGAFAAGLVLASTEHKARITEKIQPVADIFVPVFFLLVGLRVDLRLFLDWKIIGLAAVLLAVAIPTKVLAGFAAVRQNVDRLAIGIGMVPRAEVGLIFASLGLANGILDHGAYGAAILAILSTILITPPWLRYRLQRQSRT